MYKLIIRLKPGLLRFSYILLLLCNVTAYGQDAISLFNEYSSRIYQIRIIEQASGKQAAIGSGFQISGDGIVVTNYHVVSEYINNSDRYHIEYVDHNGEKGALTLIDFDVINDLALVKRDIQGGQFLAIATSLPRQGEAIYSLGNPHDLGLTVIPGTYNGIAAYSLYQRIHFSGSINPGMSGGPVLNSSGEVVGVNVATAGNQISFLVPLDKLSKLINRLDNQPIDLNDVKEIITNQLALNQQDFLGNLVNGEWVTAEFKGVTIPNEIADYIRCWGSTSNDPDIQYENYGSVCSQGEQIYLSSSFTTGSIVYQFNWLESEALNPSQFYNMYKSQISNVYPDNYAGKDDVTDYECYEEFMDTKSRSGMNVKTKGTFCARLYKEYQDLYDVLYLSASVHENKKGLISHFTLSGVSKELAMVFTKKFISNIIWN